MKKLTQNLNKQLKSQLGKADEVWIAVALITKSGLKFIQSNLKKGAKQHYILGIDLPTDPKALTELNKQQTKGDVYVSMYAEQEFYHPKLYVVKTGSNYTAFIGSANCTTGGLFNNVELSFVTKDKDDCSELLNWLNGINSKAARLNQSFITKYKIDYEKRKQRKKQDEKEAKEAKEKLNQDYEAAMTNKKELVKILKRYRNKAEYKEHKSTRNAEVKALKKSLDYPDFKNIEVDEFFANWALGHLIAIPKPTIKSNLKRFKKLLTVLTDESIDVSVRVDRALKGDLEIRGVKEALITKVLTIHKPKLYFVKNGKSDAVLKSHGIELPRGISKGEKYKATAKYLQELCTETGMDDFAILDYYLYLEA